MNAFELCLVIDVVLPMKFKVHDLKKYNRLYCPKNHLILYCRKMVPHAQDDKLLIPFYKDTLRQNRFLAAPLRQRFSPKALLHVKKK